MRKYTLVVIAALSLAGCHSSVVDRLTGKDPTPESAPGPENPRVFGLFPGQANNLHFSSYPGGTQTFEFRQVWRDATGVYFDGVNTYLLTAYIVGPNLTATVTGPGCVEPTQMKLHYVPGLVNYHFVVDEFSGCGVSAPPDDFCVDGSVLCGSGR